MPEAANNAEPPPLPGEPRALDAPRQQLTDTHQTSALADIDALMCAIRARLGPSGLIGFEAAAAIPDGAEDAGDIPFSLLIETDAETPINGFWKQDSTGGWVNLASAEYGGRVTQVGNKVRLDFVIEDNGPFDTNAYAHYLGCGGHEGRAASDAFASGLYLLDYPDVQAAGMNPLLHFLSFGIEEGRHAQYIGAEVWL